MRVRVSLRALWALYDKRNLLNPSRHPLFAWPLIYHKVLRYLAFLLLAALLVFNALAVFQHGFTPDSGSCRGWFMRLPRWGPYSGDRERARPDGWHPIYYFVVLNVACLLAFWKFSSGRKMVLWYPKKGA